MKRVRSAKAAEAVVAGAVAAAVVVVVVAVVVADAEATGADATVTGIATGIVKSFDYIPEIFAAKVPPRAEISRNRTALLRGG